jgi:NAD/NADP transhydrogenase alpha subunit
LNVVGGFVVTDRMLHMFKPRTETKPKTPETPPDAGGSPS